MDVFGPLSTGVAVGGVRAGCQHTAAASADRHGIGAWRDSGADAADHAAGSTTAAGNPVTTRAAADHQVPQIEARRRRVHRPRPGLCCGAGRGDHLRHGPSDRSTDHCLLDE